MTSRYWQEDEADEAAPVTGDIADLGFAVSGTCLPVDHAYALSRALAQALPWLEQVPGAGMHLIHGADSGNGWYRPEGDGALLYLARRTRLTLRLPRARLADAQGLTGASLDVAGHRLTVGAGAVRPLAPAGALYARYVVDEHGDESAFLDRVAAALEALGVGCKKILCGKGHRLALPDGGLATRSVLVADLSPAESLRLQQAGVGARRLLGCGLFVPHKSLNRNPRQDDQP